MSHQSSTDADLSAMPWDEIERLLVEIEQSAQAGDPSFYQQTLGRTARAAQASAAAVWLAPAGKPIQMACKIDAAAADLFDAQAPWRRKLIAAVLKSAAPLTAPARSEGEQTALQNPTDFILLLQPIVQDGRSIGILEIAKPADTPVGQQRICADLLAAVAEFAADYERRGQIAGFSQRQALWGELEQFTQRIHTGLQLDRTAFAIVNEGRRIARCDRMTLLTVRGDLCRVEAVSGLEQFDPRSPTILLQQELAGAVAAADEPLWRFDEQLRQENQSAPPFPPQIEAALDAYLDEAHPRGLGVLPIHPPVADETATNNSSPIAALIAENFDGVDDPAAFRFRVETLAKQSATALDNAISLENIPLLPALRKLGQARWFVQARQLPYTVTAGVAAGVLLLALLIIPWQMKVTGRGRMIPKTQQVVFAPLTGEVEELQLTRLKDDDARIDVKAGQPLLSLRDRDLEYELARVTGEKRAAQEQQHQIEKTLLNFRRNTPESLVQLNELTAKKDALVETAKRHAAQEKVLLEQLAGASIVSPLDGRVLTWDVDHLLENRPVQRGQALMTIANLEGDWVLDLWVSDRHIGYVLDRWRQADADVRLDFILASDPANVYAARIIEIAPAAEIDPDGQPAVRIKAAIDSQQVKKLRPGASVVANISCGRKPLGYVLFHDLIEAVRTWLFI